MGFHGGQKGRKTAEEIPQWLPGLGLDSDLRKRGGVLSELWASRQLSFVFQFSSQKKIGGAYKSVCTHSCVVDWSWVS